MADRIPAMQRRNLLLATLATPALAQAPQQGEALAPGWRMDTLMRWGDGVTADAPPWNPAAPDADAAAAQFGWDGRVVAALAPPRATDGIPRAILAITHPGVDAAMAFPDGRDRPDVAAAMQGASIINLENRAGAWVVSAGGFQSRRLHGATLCRGAGPGAERMGSAIRGVFGLDGGCAAPGNRLLMAEGQASDWAPRLPGRVGAGHGWVVECDAADPGTIPVKRSALGRGADDLAATLAADGRLVVVMAHAAGLARFISAGPASDPDALDQGTLWAGRFGGAGLEWQALAAEAWADLPAALAAAGATRPRGSLGISFGPAGLLAAGSDGTLMAWRASDAAATTYPNAALGGRGRLPGQTAAVAGPDGRIWRGSDPVPGLAGGVWGGRADITLLLAMPRGAAAGGLALAPEGRSLFTVIRAPGREPGRSFARPATRWPDFTPGLPPRSALVAMSGGL